MPSTGASPEPGELHVAVAVVRDAQNRILITRRHANSHQGGLWEFPGGKLEAGENLASALRRELAEEVGIRVTAHHPLLALRHDYGDKRVLLDVHEVTGWDGEARPLEGQPLHWVTVGELAGFEFPAANQPILQLLLQEMRAPGER